LFPLLRGLVSFYQVRGQHPRARDVGDELLALAERSDDRVAQVQAHYGQGVTLYDLVKLDASQQHLERALALYDPAMHATHVSVYGGYDPGVACRGWLGWVQWTRGAVDQAARSVERSVALAERLGHPFTLDFAYLAAATVRLFRGETQLAVPHLERAAEISRQEGFAYQRAIGASLEGWASLTIGRPEEAITLLEESLAGYEATGAAVARPGILALLALATAMRGDVKEGLRLVAQGLAEAERTAQQLHLVQLYVTRGDLLLWSAGTSEAAAAEACYRQAFGVARSLRAPMLELRPAMRLAGVLNQDGRADEARALLGPVVEQFTEGLELRDLRGARQLLAS
jgi:tetratricopeptide (TPR) repeat protein